MTSARVWALRAVLEMPDISYEELSDKLKDEGFGEVKFSTIRTMRNDTLITMRVACELGLMTEGHASQYEFPMAGCAFVLFDRNEWAQYRNAAKVVCRRL